MPPRPDPPPPFFSRGRVPVLTADEMRAWDRRAIDDAGVPERVLMENAGRAVAAVIQRAYPEGRVLVACGSGNNGGDGLVAARTLRAWGRDVRLLAAGSRPPDPSLAHGWEMEMVAMDELDSAVAAAEVLVDALLGTGSTGAPRDPYGRVIRAMNDSGRPIVAVDGPSGIDFTTGAAAGEVVHAAVTVTFGAPKRGLLLFPGREHAGRIVCVEIGFDPPGEPATSASPGTPEGETSGSGARPGAELITHGWAMDRLPPVPPNAHKGQMGRVVIVAGRAGMAGASVLAGMGALRAGAGMAVLVAPEANRVILQSAIPEALYEDRASVDADVFAKAEAIVAGPGMGTDGEALALLRKLAAAGDCPLLLDADATTLLARNPQLRADIHRPLLLTPHPGEAGRLLGRSARDVTADPFSAAAELSERFDCAVLLKGAPSLVAAPGEATLVSVGGHSGIATGGMGDTLSGVTGALLALCRDPRTAAGLGLWYCGRAAELAGRGRGLLPRDVADAVPGALLEPRESRTPDVEGVILDLQAPH